ncbi:lysophospholipid acyltransferase family protein [Archangium lipolyticum]|uniref:lysophospholipid acyltransferase family protein n=1 Tax=Archangium lipolyticum TaxID=2970465 RepID=UPI00214A35B3|nr:lysophospholipid acyltransferase family protein [Archangium lipolyticum]
MASKGVLGNDPFQRGAAQRPAEPKKAQAEPPATKKSAPPAKAAKKAPAPKEKPAARAAAPKPAAPKSAPKPAANATPRPAEQKAATPRSTTHKPAEPKSAPASATGARAKKATPSREKAAPEAVPPQAEVRTPPKAVSAAAAEMALPVEPPVPPTPEPVRAEAREEERPTVEEPAAAREPEAPAVPSGSEESEEDEELLERAAEALTAAETLRELEDAIGEALSTAAVTVPGFEDAATRPVAEVVAVEVIDGSRDEYAPSSEAEAEVEARIEVEVEAALAPALPVARSHTEVFFTDESPGAEPRRFGERFAGLMSLAKDVAFQAVASERFSKTVSSAQGLLGAALTGIGLGMGGGTAIDEYGKDAALGNVLQPVLDFLYERYWRVSVQGASHVPAGPVLLVANHSGALPFDGPMLQQSLSRERPDLQEARWLAEDQVFHAPMLGTLMNRLGAVRACPENALRLLDELRPVIVFPEGIQGLGKPFAQRYQLKRFGRGGFVKLALRTGAPIVPVAIVGAEETAPLFGKLPASFLGLPYLPLTPPPLPARWTIRFGEPIGMGELPPEAADDMSQVQRLTERTRESIQGMLQALLKERRSVFSG